MKQTAIMRTDADRKRVLDVLAAVSLGKPVRVEWEVGFKRRSLNQNNLYHMLVGVIAKETGNSHEAVHEAIKQRFVAPEFIELAGKTHEVRTTTKFNTADFSDLTTQVYALGAEMGIYLPSPEELGRTR